MAHHKREGAAQPPPTPSTIQAKDVLPSTYSAMSSAFAGSNTTLYKWITASFVQGQISLESGTFYNGRTAPDPDWAQVPAGAITVYLDGMPVLVPIVTSTTATSTSNAASTGILSSTLALSTGGATSTTRGGTTDTLPGITPTTTPTSSSTVQPQQDQPSGLVTSGAVVGAAIGCLLAGFLIGGLIAWFVLRKRGARGAQRAAPEYAPVHYDSSPEKQGAAVSTAAASSNHSGLGLEQFLLDSKPDSEIATEAVSRNELVQQHVESHYHLQNVQQDPNALAKTLAELEIGIENGTGAFGPAHLANLALDPRTRYAALRHVISQAAFNASSVHHSGPISLLPNQVGSVVRGVPPVERHRGNAQAVDAAFTRWRQLSAFLLNPTRSERTPLVPTEDVSTQQAQYLTTILNQFTGVFASGDREQAYEQENHLREVIVECASLGYVLFSQPAEFRFNFTDKASRGEGLVAFPGLEKVRDESGMTYQSPITVTEPVVQR